VRLGEACVGLENRRLPGSDLARRTADIHTGRRQGLPQSLQGNPVHTRNDKEREVALAYSKLETAAHTRNSTASAPMVSDEFVAASSYSDKLRSKRSRMAEFNRSKDAGVAPTALLSVRVYTFGDAVLMISEHKPDRGKPLHVTRVAGQHSPDVAGF
jgi:hypothetical protein